MLPLLQLYMRTWASRQSLAQPARARKWPQPQPQPRVLSEPAPALALVLLSARRPSVHPQMLLPAQGQGQVLAQAWER
jgi:hypothetical protein